MRSRRRRYVTGTVFVLVVSLILLLGGPPESIGGEGAEGFPLAWLWNLLPVAVTSWANPPPPPVQESGTAAGHSHYVSSGATHANSGAGRPAGTGAGQLPDYHAPNAAKKQTKTPAAGTGDHFDVKTSKRIGSAASALQDVYQNADGTYTRRVSQVPVNYRAADGSWKAIDTSLAANKSGRWQQRANGQAVQFAPSAADPALVSIDIDSTHRFAYGLTGAAKVSPSVSGGTATYVDVMPEVDLSLASLSAGVKETLILKSAGAGTSWVFPVQLIGLAMRLEKDGSVSLLDGSGTVVGVVPAPYMQDSSLDTASGEPALSDKVSYSIVSLSGGGQALRVDADAAWIHDPSRVFPVKIDPTYNTYYPSASTYVEPSNPGNNSSADRLKVGTSDGGVTAKAYSFLQFSSFTTSFQNAKVSSATLNLFNFWTFDCTSEPFSVNPILASWTPSTVSYAGPALGAAIGSATLAPSHSACADHTASDPSTGSWMQVGLSGTTFDGWLRGSSPNYGLAITASQTSNTQWKQFDSIHGPNPPYLDVTYTPNDPPSVDAQYPSNSDSPSSLTPELMAHGVDSDNWPGSGLSYDFQVFKINTDDSHTLISDSNWLSQGDWVVPAGILSWGNVYAWDVVVKDGGPAFSDPNATVHYLNMSVPQPPITSTLSQSANSHGFDPRSGDFTTSATDAQIPSIGPPLSVVRDYNSADPRINEALGSGWSSMFDAKATEQLNAAGTAVAAVVVTYPDGSDVAFGRNSDGTFAPPTGRFSTFTPATGGGYTLTDKNDTIYRFTQTLTAGVFGLTSVADASGRTETVTYGSGHVTTVTAASGRKLTLAWQTPSGASAPHVSSVTTDPVTPGSPTTALTWTYTYSGDKLTKVCSPDSTTACTTYGYTTVSRYPSVVQNADPHSYWRLNDTSGTRASSSVLANGGSDAATYHSVTLNQAAALPGSTSPSVTLNGSSAQIELNNGLIQAASYQTIGMWFKTTTADRVLFSYQTDPVTSATTASGYTPALYIGTDGHLLGSFWNGGVGNIASPAAVTDGQWHYVVLAAAGSNQTLYLDGAAVGSRAGLVQLVTSNASSHVYVGAGFNGGGWPDESHNSGTNNTGYASFFNGSISDVAFYDQSLAADAVNRLYFAGHASASVLSSVTAPSGILADQIAYNTVNGTVDTVTDQDGGVWQVKAPVATGSSQVFAASVLNASPTDYWRLGDLFGTTPTNQVQGGTATYNGVTLGATGPFVDAAAPTFDGSTSYVSLPSTDVPGTGPVSVSMWFNMPSGNTSGGVLFGYEGAPITAADPTISGWSPALYVGTDGKLRGQYWCSTGCAGGPIATAGTVNDGRWHYVALTSSGTVETLYLDGVQVGTLSGGPAAFGQAYAYVGAGESGGAWPSHPVNTRGYFTGRISDFAYYNNALPAATIAAEWSAAQSSTGLVPQETTTVVDPGGKQLHQVFDLANGGRLVSVTDGLGDTTTYGYDTGGFINKVTDPNGISTTTGHDARGNAVSRTACQNQATNSCSTTYYTYYPNDDAKTLTPDPLNDLALTVRGAGSSSATDNKYLTTLTYDARGNVTAVQGPVVPGFPSGRTTATTYTDGTTIAAVDGGYAPAGLPATVTTPAGAVSTTRYYRNGDKAQTVDAAGLVTNFTYDGVGRLISSTVISDTFPAGLTTTSTYDGQGHPLVVTAPPVVNRVTGATHTARTTTTYNVDGGMLSQSITDTTGGDASRTVSMTYNARGQVATETSATGGVTHFTYDNYGHKLTQTDPRGVETDFAYDDDGHLLTTTLIGYIGDPTSPSPATNVVTSSNAYDPTGRVASVTDAMGWVTAYTYTDDGKVVTITRSDPIHGTSFVQQANTYDAAGNLLTRKTNNGTTTMAYTVDNAGRVVSATVDPTGLNRSVGYTYSGDDQVLSSTLGDASGPLSVTESTYDPLGRTISTTTRDPGLTPADRWPLTDGSGTTAKDTTGNAPATSTGPVTWSSAHGGSATFTSTSAPLTTRPVVDTTHSFTVSAWVYLTSGANDAMAVSQWGSTRSSFSMGYDHDLNKWVFRQPDGEVDSAAASALNTWTHLTGVLDSASGQLTFYVNGSSQGSQPATIYPNSDQQKFAIGSGEWDGDVGSPFTGSVADVQTYNQALNGTQVSAVYGGTIPAAGSVRTRTTSTLDKRGLPTSQTDPNGNTTTYAYDEAGHVTLTTAPTVNTEINGGTPVATHPMTVVGYDTFGAPVETSDPDGNVTVVGYDAAGRANSLTLPAYTPPGSSTPLTSVSSRTFDAVGNVLTSTDAANNTTTNTYDQLGRLVATTYPNTGVAHRSYDLDNDVLSVTDPTGAQTKATYDYLGRQITTTEIVRQSSASNITNLAYNTPGGWLTSSTSPGSVVSSYTYDALGEPLTVADTVGNTSRYTYDGLGRTTKVTAPDSTYTTATYDALNHTTGVAYYSAAGAVLATQSATYDADGAVTTATDPRGNTSTFRYDATGLLTSQTQPVATGTSMTTSFGYDAVGNRTRYTDGRGNAFITTYNVWNQAQSELEPDTPSYHNTSDRTTTMAYDVAGRPKTQTAPGNVVTTAGYDAMGEMTSLTGTGAEAATTGRTFGYDLAGRPTSASAPGGTDAFTWDDRGLLLTTTGPSGSSTFTYTVDGLPATRADAAGTTTYTYDTDDRLKSVTNPTTSVSETFSYNSLSQPTVMNTGSDTRSFGYDPMHRLASDTLKTSTATTIASIAYGYDANGNETSKNTTGFAGSSNNTYTYDLANRLSSWNNGTTTTGYAYDAAGNRTQIGSRTLTYDARDRLTSSGTSTYTYTARGTLASTITGGTTTTSTADAFDQTITQGAATYRYDALGRVTNTGFSYTGLGNTLAADPTSTYTRDPADGLTAVKSGTTALYAWTDQHSDVVAQYTGAATALTGSATYNPLGVVTAHAGAIGNLGYQSGWTDSSTGQVNMAARWYNPDTGQFNSQDTAAPSPAPSPAAANPYAYGADNPLTNTDPSGHACMQARDDAIVIACIKHPVAPVLHDECHPTCKTVSEILGSCPHNPMAQPTTIRTAPRSPLTMPVASTSMASTSPNRISAPSTRTT